jgi:catalase (peroxidase I)
MPLPPAPTTAPDWTKVRNQIKAVLASNKPEVLTPDNVQGEPYYGALLSTLAWQCASTFRATDYAGGCNGARIRFAPQKDWGVNKGMDAVLKLLKPVKDANPSLTWADLIVLAGTVANDFAAGAPYNTFKFCPGRSDAANGKGMEPLKPRIYNTVLIAVRDNMRVMGLTPREMVALSARLRSPTQQQRLGYTAKTWTTNPGVLSNQYFKTLLLEDWQKVVSGAGKEEYKAVGKTLYMMPSDLVLKWDAEFAAIAQEYASDNTEFKKAFASAWTKVMNADRFKGPDGNMCA